jgi:hypothetical protein
VAAGYAATSGSRVSGISLINFSFRVPAFEFVRILYAGKLQQASDGLGAANDLASTDGRAGPSPHGGKRALSGQPLHAGLAPVANLQQQTAATNAQPNSCGCACSRLARLEWRSTRPAPPLCKQGVRGSSPLGSTPSWRWVVSKPGVRACLVHPWSGGRADLLGFDVSRWRVGLAPTLTVCGLVIMIMGQRGWPWRSRSRRPFLPRARSCWP